MILFRQRDSYFLRMTNISCGYSLWEGMRRMDDLPSLSFEFFSFTHIHFFSFAFITIIITRITIIMSPSFSTRSLTHLLPPYKERIFVACIYIFLTYSLFHSLAASFTLLFTHSFNNWLIISQYHSLTPSFTLSSLL